MSLEDKIAELIEAVRENTVATKEANALRTDAIGAVKEAAGAKASTKETKSTAKAADPQPAADKQPAAAATNASTSDRVTDEQAAKVSELCGKYISGADRADQAWATAERDARKARVRTLLRHQSVMVPGTPEGVYDTKNITADGFTAAVNTLESWLSKNEDMTQAPAPAAAAGGASALDL